MNNKPFSVSLAPQTKDLYSYYDLSLKDKEEIVNKFINTLVNDELKEFSDKWFVEYSVLATTIDPIRTNENTGQLRCYSFIQDNGDISKDGLTFKDKIEKYISPIIAELKATTEGEDNNWWFHNPETFLAPQSVDPYISFTNNQDVDPDIFENISKSADIREQELREGKTEGKYKQPDANSLFYFSSMEYSRTFSDMLNYSRTLYNTKMSTDANHINDILIRHYHEGVENARLYYDKFVADKDKDEEFCYLTFPVVASPARFITPGIYKKSFGDDFLQDRHQGIGHCFIYFNIKEPASLKIEDLKKKIQFLFQDINNTLHNFAFNYTFNIGLLLQEKAKKEAEKSAKAAIMSRNMSHNLGSHVMSYLKQHLGSVKDMVNDRILANIITGENDLTKKLNHSLEDIELPFLVGMGHFVSYLQERQDFIATIATDFVPYYSTVNFKDGIYDTLNPDKKYERHSNKETVLQTDNILLGNIARSEGLGRKTSPTESTNDHTGSTLSDIVLKFKDFNGNALEGKFLNQSDKPYLADMRDSLEEMRLCDVSLPGGIVGRQAIFSIVENVIRNAAKHGHWRKTGHLEVTFNVFKKEDLGKDELKCYLDDKFSSKHLSLRDVFNRFYCSATDANDLYFVTLTDNLEFKEEALKQLRKAIAEPYVNERGELEGANKGIKEMRISASWLRSVSDESGCIPDNFDPASDLDWQKPEGAIAPILYARISKDRGNENIGHLQYIFCIVRPKKVAILSSTYDAKRLTPLGRDKLVCNSWGIFSPEEFKLESNKSYEFIILLDKDKYIFQDSRRRTSSRLFSLSEVRNKIKHFPEENILLDNIYNGDFEPDKLMRQLYEFLADYNDEHIGVIDDRAWGNIKKESKPPRIDIGITSVYMTQDNSIQYPYVYRNHYELSKNFNTVIDELETTYKGSLFIEGISGSNSTDRLVRNETIDDKWGFKHLHVMKEKIAIFDERIFSKVYGIEESDFVTFPFSVKTIMEQQKLYVMDEVRKRTAGDPKQDFICAIPIALAADLREIEDEARDISELDSLFKEVNYDGIELKTVAELQKVQRYPIAKDYIGTTNSQKGISVFTIIKKVSNPSSEKSENNNDSNVFYLCGLQNRGNAMSTLYREMTNEIDNETKKVIITSKSICKKLAEISWRDSPDKPLFIQPIDGTPEEVIKGTFDSFSIHQGLLDKLYEGFGIKNSPEKKELLTKNFYDYFKKETESNKSFSFRDENDTYDHWFLPGMAIHSGRSKPSTNDMPQQVPFIQYASIEHAVFDCKYTLVELLDYARYE